MKPEALAVRAVNQYRRRDILAYLGLRYYLENEAAKRDVWAKNVSTYLVNGRRVPIYFRSYHFKEISDQGNVVYRNLYVPGPNEILAETVLLHECSLHYSFRSMACVYSYHFPDAYSRDGVFRSYFPRYRSRHQSIANACRGLGQATVRYTDIRKFYPSIPMELARDAWKSACDSSKVLPVTRELGERLLNEHFKVAVEQQDGLSILTGPMFSHLIANLVLFGIDKTMYEEMEGKYWRYVDDIVLVGDAKLINDKREYLRALLSDLGLSLHEEEKDFAVDSETWLEGVNDFSDSNGDLWMNLISNIKRFLIAKPGRRMELVQAFLDNGINIPIMDYSAAVSESSYIEKFTDFLSRNPWFPKSIRNLSVQKLVRDALHARNVYQEKVSILFDDDPQIKGYKRKRLLPKLRFYAGRLSYLAIPEALSSISSSLANYPEMLLESTVMNAIQSRDVTFLLKFGANAVQAAAQVFRVRKDFVSCSSDSLEDVEIQGIAILKLNGIDVKFSEQLSNRISSDQLNQFASGDNPTTLMKSNDMFIKEIACLRGVQNLLRHQVLLDTAFDRDEHMVFDVINQLRDSSYF
jgi:hypothetical protein